MPNYLFPPHKKVSLLSKSLPLTPRKIPSSSLAASHALLRSLSLGKAISAEYVLTSFNNVCDLGKPSQLLLRLLLRRWSAISDGVTLPSGLKWPTAGQVGAPTFQSVSLSV